MLKRHKFQLNSSQVKNFHFINLYFKYNNNGNKADEFITTMTPKKGLGIQLGDLNFQQIQDHFKCNYSWVSVLYIEVVKQIVIIDWRQSMRASFKNDLYYFALSKEKDQKSVQATASALLKSRPGRPSKRKRHVKEQKKDSEPQQIKQSEEQIKKQREEQMKNLKLSQEDFQGMLKNMSKKKESKEGNNSNNIFSNNGKRANLVFKEQITEKTPDEMKEAEEHKKKNIDFFKLQKQIKKAAQEADRIVLERQKEKDKNKQGKPDQDNKKDEKQSQKEGAGQVPDEQSNKKKTKRIKKVMNYVSYDPKRKYRDRFVGAMNSNQRFYNKNGRMKFKYRPKPSELNFEDGQIGDTYVSSLSKALTITVSLEDSQDQSEWQQEVVNNPSSPLQFSKQSLTEYLQAAFGFEFFREGQYETINHIMNGQSVVFISQTASGKSLTYIMSSMLMGGLTIVVSPLVSLILDQLAHLPATLPAACISSLITREQRDKIIRMVKTGLIQLLFITPESLQSDFIYHLQDFPQVNFVCVDEAHSLSELSHNFRTAFLGLGQILLKHIKYRSKTPTIVALTATANPQTVLSIKDRLNISNEIRSSSCMNKNLFVTISRESGHSKYDSLISYLREDLIQKCKGILVYARTRYIMNEVFNYITNSTSLNTRIYHSALTTKEKTQTLSKFRTGEIKVVVATVALGMGLDFANLECVIHLNMPKSIENYVQEIGRAGRRENRAYCHLFLDDNDYITERNYIIADELEPKTLLSLYEKLRQNSKDKMSKEALRSKKREEADLVVRRAAIILEQKVNGSIIEEQDEEEEGQENEGKEVKEAVSSILGDYYQSKLFSIRIQKLVGATQLRQQSLLTLLLKIESLTKNWDVRLRVLPTSYEVIKVGFFKGNQQEIRKESPFFVQLTSGCRRAGGTIYINLIDKCNKLELRPINLLTQLYRVSNHYTVRVELDAPLYVWQLEWKKELSQEDSVQDLITKGFQRLSSEEEVEAVLQAINHVQGTSEVKLNTLYTVARLYARNNMRNIVEKRLILPPSKPIPSDSIVRRFDDYFRANLHDYYQEITENGNEVYIPTQMVEEREKDQIYDNILMFFRNEMNYDEAANQVERKGMKRKLIERYQDGKTITRILMGVNTGEVSWKLYGERKYWMLYKNKNYHQLLEAVRGLIQEYKNTISFTS